MDKGKRRRGGGVTAGGLFRRIASAQPPRPPPTMPDGGPSADQPPSIGGRPPPPAPRAREPTAAPALAVFRQVAQWRHGLLLHLPPKKGGNCCHNCLLWQQFWHLQQVFAIFEALPAAPHPLQWHRLTSWTADHGPSWVGGWFTDLGTGSAQNLSTTLPPPPMFSHSCPFLSI